MSFINDALKKAQQRKDGNYSNYEKLITGPQEQPGKKRARKAKWIFLPLAFLVLAGAAIIIYQETSWRNFPAKRPGNEVRQPVQVPAVQPQAPPGDAAALYSEALKSQLAGDSAQAETLYRQIIASNPGHIDALNNLGVILLSGGKTEEAMDLFNRAISLKPDFADAYYNLACSYAKLRSLEDGLRFLEHAIMIKPELAAFAGGDNDLQYLRSSPKFRQIVNKKE